MSFCVEAERGYDIVKIADFWRHVCYFFVIIRSIIISFNIIYIIILLGKGYIVNTIFSGGNLNLRSGLVDFGVLFYVAEHEIYFVVSDKCVNFAA